MIQPYKYWFKPQGIIEFPEPVLLNKITETISNTRTVQMLDMTTKERYSNTMNFQLLLSKSTIDDIGDKITQMVSCGTLDAAFMRRSYNEEPALIITKKMGFNNNTIVGLLTFNYNNNIINISSICSVERGIGSKLLNYFMNIIRITISEFKKESNNRYKAKIALEAIDNRDTMAFYSKFKFKKIMTDSEPVLKIPTNRVNLTIKKLVEMEHSNKSKSSSPYEWKGRAKTRSKSRSSSPTESQIAVFNIPISRPTKQTFEQKMERIIERFVADIEINKETNSKFTIDDLNFGLEDLKLTSEEKQKALIELNKLL